MQKRRDKYELFEDLDDRFKALEEKLSNFDLKIENFKNVSQLLILWTKNDSGDNKYFFKRNSFETIKKEL